MRTIILFIFSIWFCSSVAIAQIDTTSYPAERTKIKELMRQRKPDKPVDCLDMIAVGPKGDISFSHQEWQKVQAKEKVIFKSVRVVPGTEYIRIYEGNTAVVNFLADVKLVVDGKDVNIKVRRLEVYHQSEGSWCRVAGQGTEVDEKLFPIKSN